MQPPFPLLKHNGIILRNPIGCACFCCLALLGALIGRAAFRNVYEGPALALLSALSEMEKPQYRPALILLYALLPPTAYCAALFAAGFRRIFLPLWALSVLLQGVCWGVQLGAASVLMRCNAVNFAVFALLIPMLMLMPLYLYIALLSAERVKRKQEPLQEGDALETLVGAVLPATALVALHTLFATLACAYGLDVLFH